MLACSKTVSSAKLQRCNCTGIKPVCSLSSAGVLDLNKVPGLSVVNLCWNAPGLCQVQNFKGVTALTTRLFVACLTEQHWGSGPKHGSRLVDL